MEPRKVEEGANAFFLAQDRGMEKLAWEREGERGKGDPLIHHRRIF